jgi:hypothetical protein
MRKYAWLSFDIGRDVTVGLLLGLVFVIGVLIFGILLAALLVIAFVICAVLVVVGTPILAAFVFVLVLVGYPISSGRSVKTKIKEFQDSLKPTQAN